MSFHHPSIWFLLLLALVPLVWWRWWSPRRRAAISFPMTGLVRRIGPGVWGRLRWLPALLRTLALVLLVVAMARPQQPDAQTHVLREGIAIQMVLDRSISMSAMDFQSEGRAIQRLDAVKLVVRDFVLGGEELPGRPNDLIGLIGFAGWADSYAPLTLDHEHLMRSVMQIEIAPPLPSEAGTAIGDAVALGVERLRDLNRQAANGRSPVKSQVMVLLTDGENNAGELDPIQAAELAAAFDIRMYVIGVGTDQGYVRDPSGLVIPLRFDEETLQEMARITDGRYFRATDTASLREIYEAIDRLEKTEVEQRRYLNFAEAAVEPVDLGPVRLPPLLLVVFLLVLAESVLVAVKFHSVP